jgi:hypothetical protein
MDESRIDSPETVQKFFDRFFAYDLLDRYPNHRIATEADYSLRRIIKEKRFLRRHTVNITRTIREQDKAVSRGISFG